MQGCWSGLSSDGGIVWRWHQSDTEIYGPVFSPDATEIAFARKHHIPDGHEAEGIPEAKRKEESRRIDGNERYADPQIIVLRVGGDPPTAIDWGWAPAFSPDGNTLAGNEIRLYDRTRKTVNVLATPAAGFLSDPLFSPDGRYVVYSIGGAVNGAYGGNVGLGRVALNSATVEILYPPSKNYDLFHLVDPKRFVSDRLLALRCRPAVAGTYVADEYECDLVDARPPQPVVYSWGRHRSVDLGSFAFAQGPDGELLVYNKGWRPAGRTSSPSGFSGPPTPTDERPGIPSPNAMLVADANDSTIVVRDLRTNAKRREWKLAGPIRDSTWSRDSKVLAVVVTHYRSHEEKRFDFDEVIVLRP